MTGNDSLPPPDMLLSELPVSDAERDALPFNTCLNWQEQRVEVLGHPAVVVKRSFSWAHRGDDGWVFRGNEMLVCPRCHSVWACLDFGRPMVMGEARGCLWPRAVTCEDCEPSGPEDVPGSLLCVGPYSTDLPLLFSLPAELVKREAELHLKQAERELYGADTSSGSG